MSAQPSEWDLYFRLRGVEPRHYDNQPIPGYLRTALPKELTAPICDIGCGYGQTLIKLKRQGYKNLIGIEPCLPAANHVRSQGINVIHGTIEEAGSKVANGIEFAYMSHVLEHIPKGEIIKTLTLIKNEVLAPGGQLLVAVPNAQAYTGAYWRYEDWTHETLFTAGSLLYVMRAAGFDEVSIFDPDCMLNTRPQFKPFRRLLLAYYKLRYSFWMKVTSSSTHRFSPNVFSFEVKAIGKRAKNDL